MIASLLFLELIACKAASNGTPIPPPETAQAAPEEEPLRSEGEENAPTPGVKAPGNLPVVSQAELAAEDAARADCIKECVQSRQMEAVAIEMIEEGCRQGCMDQHPIRQVEVEPSVPAD